MDGRGLRRDLAGEDRALAGYRAHRHAAVKELGDALDNREPEPQPAVAVPVLVAERGSPRRSRPACRRGCRCRCPTPRCAETPRAGARRAGFALLGVGKGVGEEIAQDAFGAGPVRAQVDRWRDDAEAQPPFGRARGEFAGKLDEQLSDGKTEGEGRLTPASSFETSKQRIEQRLEALKDCCSLSRTKRRSSSADPVLQHRHEQVGRLQRLAQIVARRGQELRLGEVARSASSLACRKGTCPRPRGAPPGPSFDG